MKVVILAGGLGTRISEETDIKPKPMVTIGGYPILWHILKIYSAHGFHDFIICLGYKGYVIKEYFANYFLHMSDVTFDLRKNEMIVHQKHVEPWKVTLVDTGLRSSTGDRVRYIAPYVENETFMMTYGDGVANIDIAALVRFHESHGKLATVTATQPAGKLGAVGLGHGDIVETFREKPPGDGGWISCGFFVLNPGVFDYLVVKGDTSFENRPLATLARDRQLVAFRHTRFWQAMDTLRERNLLEQHWESGKAPWKIWHESDVLEG